ncbi:hypothetical protein [Pontibacter amylolyticus]|uniref:Uncharacterized protein n=1 Tax=Pontibacter amylolyticus TaxID=1424080 RepID=A0ABQ1W0R6_9BACT|nr:hypothetical protein [Pontibacter amylolyticus]GGG08547.1 hypothetical protein GCM10011323_11370 [Pontibacter amylolyticus]
MTFEEYLIKKRINRDAFAAEDPGRYRAWESMYAQMHPNSFYVAVKMVLNNVRLRYHLREEDVPRPATTSAPRPAARRAAPSGAIPEAGRTAAIPAPQAEITPDALAIPATPDVPQETTEEKPVIPAAAPKPRPVVRRPAALQTPAAEDEAPAPAKQAEEAAKPAAPRARPVIKRPAALAKPEDQPTREEQDTKAIPEQAASSEASAEAAKPVRPRPVIKRPTALQNPLQGEEQPVSGVADEGIAPASETAAEAPKPPRPRPVIKRPIVLQKPVEEQQLGSGIEAGPAAAETAPTGIDNPTQSAAEGAPKPPRPRPVMKRSAALSKPAAPEAMPEEAKSAEGELAIPDATVDVSPEKKFPANELAAETSPIAPITEVEQAGNQPVQHTPEAQPNAAPPAKPPRPRPIIRRPTPPVSAAPEIEPSVEEKQESPAILDRPEEAGTEEPPIPEDQAEKPKPPRPRPIIRRPPPKTEE